MAKIAMQANDPRKTRWPIATLVKLAVRLLLIAGILWWLGGMEKIVGVMGRISLGFAALVVILHTIDRALIRVRFCSRL